MCAACGGRGVVVSEVYLGVSQEEPCECVEVPSSPTRLAALTARYWKQVEQALRGLKNESRTDRVEILERLVDTLRGEISAETGMAS